MTTKKETFFSQHVDTAQKEEQSTDNIEKDKGGRPSKNVKYANEQKEILTKIFQILKVTKENPIFYVEDIDNNKEQQILDLIPDIKKYYIFSKWLYFANHNDNKTIMSLLRSIFRSNKLSIAMIYEKDNTNRITKRRGVKIQNF